MWTIEEALTLIRNNQQACMKSGYYIALAGGVLNKGYSVSDLDLLLMPRRPTSDPHNIKIVLSSFLTPVCATPQPVPTADVLTYIYEDKTVEVILVHNVEDFVDLQSTKEVVPCTHVWEKIASSMAESQYKCNLCGDEDWR